MHTRTNPFILLYLVQNHSVSPDQNHHLCSLYSENSHRTFFPAKSTLTTKIIQSIISLFSIYCNDGYYPASTSSMTHSNHLRYDPQKIFYFLFTSVDLNHDGGAAQLNYNDRANEHMLPSEKIRNPSGNTDKYAVT